MHSYSQSTEIPRGNEIGFSNSVGMYINNKVGHLLSDSNSKLAIEFGDRILLSNISSKVSEIFGRIEIESEFRQ